MKPERPGRRGRRNNFSLAAWRSFTNICTETTVNGYERLRTTEDAEENSLHDWPPCTVNGV